jgi:SWI/SNF-related matrix-associated actin-dependent regulator of chromatin subfamily A3
MNPIASRILGEFKLADEVMMQLYCHSKTALPSGELSKGRRQGKASKSWFLNAILFGTLGLENIVGDFLSGYRMYLQDPLCCERSVQYRNPHIIPPELDEVIMTDSFNCLPGNLEIERLEVGPDLLAQLIEDELLLAETEAPSIVKTALFRSVNPVIAPFRLLEANHPGQSSKTSIDFYVAPGGRLGIG